MMDIVTSTARASTYLGISVEDARKHAREIPEIDARLFVEPVRGGGKVMIGSDGSALFGSSALTVDQLVSRFRDGHRTDPSRFRLQQERIAREGGEVTADAASEALHTARWRRAARTSLRPAMNNVVTTASPQLPELYEEAVALGYQPNVDFAIKGIPGSLSSELIVLIQEDDSYIVYYRDMGRSREVARSSSFSVIRERFLEELANLAGPRGRGPTAGQKRKDPYAGMTVDERVAAMRTLGKFPRRSDVERDAPPT